MKQVGDHLAQVAVRLDGNDFDLFGRSAFNRYYYSAFLAIRSTLRRIEPGWATPSHQDMPRILTGEVLKRIKKQIKIAKDCKQITESQAQRLFSSASTAATAVAELLVSARETRRLADYEPEVNVVRSDSGMRLGEWSLCAASHWEQRVTTQAATILRVYGELGII